MKEPSKEREIAIVTGGASGIGFAIAQEFVKNNIYTVIIGRDKEKLQRAKNELGDLCETISLDLGELSKIPEAMQDIINRLGKIDILVNNAGINMKKEFCDVTDEDFMSIIHTNLISVFAISREVVKFMIPKGKGSIINISSMASQYGIPKVIAYTASKTALDGMTRAMAVELSPKGIRVNSIAPGFIATDMSAKALNNDPERKQKVMSRTPMGYLGEPSDIGTTAFFLASDSAKYITGVILPVDGGNSVGF
ncbi:SDR family oxidoreductase [Pedobacter sp. P351]|uniref:SDR family NAD(P)-dependent oxidoreductase n=1 Tax=Pedobacter superstes TaxID=3133441 RepID=UPI0030A76797